MIVFEIIDSIYDKYAEITEYVNSLSVKKLDALIFTIGIGLFLLFTIILLSKDLVTSVYMFIKETEDLNEVNNIFELLFLAKEELENRRKKNMATIASIKKEVRFVSCETNEDDIKIGEPVILCLPNGNLIKTSPVEDWSHTFGREFKIVTKNTIYRRYFN